MKILFNRIIILAGRYREFAIAKHDGWKHGTVWTPWGKILW